MPKAYDNLDQELAALGPEPSDLRALLVPHLGEEPLTLTHADALLGSLVDRLADLPLPVALPLETRPLFGTPAAAHEVSQLFESRPPPALERRSPFDAPGAFARVATVFDSSAPSALEPQAKAIVAAFGVPEGAAASAAAAAESGQERDEPHTWDDADEAAFEPEAPEVRSVPSAQAPAPISARPSASSSSWRPSTSPPDELERAVASLDAEHHGDADLLDSLAEPEPELGIPDTDPPSPDLAADFPAEQDPDLPAVLSDPEVFLASARAKADKPRIGRTDMSELLDRPLRVSEFGPPQSPSPQPQAARDGTGRVLSDEEDGDDFEILVDDEILEIAEDDVELVDEDKPR